MSIYIHIYTYTHTYMHAAIMQIYTHLHIPVIKPLSLVHGPLLLLQLEHTYSDE